MDSVLFFPEAVFSHFANYSPESLLFLHPRLGVPVGIRLMAENFVATPKLP